MSSKRIKTIYPGVYYREARRIGGTGVERVYYITFKKDGKKIEEKVGRQYTDDMTPARASRIRAERIEGKRPSRREVHQKKEVQSNQWTINRLWEEYKSGRTPSKTLAVDSGRYENYLKPYFAGKEPSKILLLDVDRLKHNFLKNKAPQTVKHVLSLLVRIVNYGVKRNLCAGLSFHVQKPQVNNITTEDLTPEQISNLLAAIDADPNIQAGNLMRMALFTGMRRGELFKLKWEDIDFHRGFITIRDPKGGRDQKIPLNDAAENILRSHPKMENSPYVFPGEDGKQRVTIIKPVNRIKKNAGLPKDFRPLHGLRHTYASMLASSGKVDMYTLQKLLTHKSPVMTQRYAHLRDETLKSASNLAEDIITKAAYGEKNEMVVSLKKDPE